MSPKLFLQILLYPHIHHEAYCKLLQPQNTTKIVDECLTGYSRNGGGPRNDAAMMIGWGSKKPSAYEVTPDEKTRRVCHGACSWSGVTIEDDCRCLNLPDFPTERKAGQILA